VWLCWSSGRCCCRWWRSGPISATACARLRPALPEALVALSRLVGDRAGRHFERSPTSPDVYPAPGSDLPIGQASQALRRGIARWRAFAGVLLVSLFYAVQDLVLGHSALTIAVGLTLLGAFVGLYLGPLPLGMFGHSPRAKHWAGYRSACPCSRGPTCSSPAAAAWCS